MQEHRQNHGKGWVVKQGMLAATGDIRLFMDADNSTTVDQVMPMLPYFPFVSPAHSQQPVFGSGDTLDQNLSSMVPVALGKNLLPVEVAKDLMW